MGRGRQGLCVGGGGGRAADTSAWSLQGSGNATRLGLPEDGRGARGLESPVPGGQGPLAEPGLARPRSQGRDGGVRCQAERMTWLSLNAGGRGPLTSGREPNSRPSARQSGTLASACPKILLLSQLLKLGALGAGRPEGARAWEPDRLRAAFPSVLLVWTGMYDRAGSVRVQGGRRELCPSWLGCGRAGPPRQASLILRHCCPLLGPVGRAGGGSGLQQAQCPGRLLAGGRGQDFPSQPQFPLQCGGYDCGLGLRGPWVR